MMYALNKIAEQFNLAEITWALGGSSLLKKYDLVEQVNDIDIFVIEQDIEKAQQILAMLGTKLAPNLSSKYDTKYFYQYNIHHTQVDLICDFKINYRGFIYSYIFDKLSITEKDSIAGAFIYYTALEDWYILYRLMDRNENDKIKNLEKHFQLHGIKHEKLLLRALENVPKELKFKIKYQLEMF